MMQTCVFLLSQMEEQTSPGLQISKKVYLELLHNYFVITMERETESFYLQSKLGFITGWDRLEQRQTE